MLSYGRKLIPVVLLLLITTQAAFACERCINVFLIFNPSMVFVCLLLALYTAFAADMGVPCKIIAALATFLVLGIILTNGFYKGMQFSYFLLRFLIPVEIFVIIRNKMAGDPKTVIPVAIAALTVLPAVIFQFFFCQEITPDGKIKHIEFVTSDYQACEYNLKDLGTAIDMYASDNSHQYPDKLSMLEFKYIRRLPHCIRENISPQTGNIFEVFNNINTGGYGYDISKDRSAYTLYCRKSNHSQINIPENFPQYSSKNGYIPR